MDESQPINFSGDAAPMHIHKKGCWQSIHDLMARLPVKSLMNILTIVFALCIVPAVIFNLITFSDLNPLDWIVSIYLLAGVGIVVGSCFPLTWLRDKILRWFLFLATYNGRGALLFMMGLLCTGISTWGILAGVGNMVLAAVHVLLWIFFHDIVGSEATQVESRLGRVSIVQRKFDVEGGAYIPPQAPVSSASSSSVSAQHEFGSENYSTNDPSNPYTVAEAYQPPELDPSTNYAVAAVSRNYNPF